MKPSRSKRRDTEADQEQRRRELIERSITGHGPEAIASRKRLANQSAQPEPAKIKEPGRTPGTTEGEAAAVKDDLQRQAQPSGQ